MPSGEMTEAEFCAQLEALIAYTRRQEGRRWVVVRDCLGAARVALRDLVGRK